MVVYVVLLCFDYEGCDIKAVRSTKEKAEKYVAEQEIRGGQSWSIEEWTVDADEGR